MQSVLKEAENRILNSKDKEVLLESSFIAMYSLFSIFCCIVECDNLELDFLEEIVNYEPDIFWPYTREEMVQQLVKLYEYVKWDSFTRLNS